MSDYTPREGRRGPTYSLWLGNRSSSALLLAGWRLRHARWEKRFDGQTISLPGYPGDIGVVGSSALLENPSDVTFEFEVFNGDESREAGRQITERLVGATLADEIWETARTLGTEPYSANRDLDIGETLSSAGYRAVDLLLCTLPTRRGISAAPLYFASRWLRIYMGPLGSITIIQSPPTGHWDDNAVRWQHHGIPSRTPSWFSNQLSQDPQRRLRHLVKDYVQHQQYFARTWSAELELWEQRVYSALAQADNTIGLRELGSIQAEIGHLAGFLAQAKISNRNLERRSEVSALIRDDSELRRLATDNAEELAGLYESDRGKLRAAMILLNTLVNSVQARASEAQQQATERTQHSITVITTLFLVPSLVIGVYGADLRELSPGTLGTVPNLSLWLIAALGVSWAGLRVVEKTAVVSYVWWRWASALMIYGGALLIASSATSSLLASGPIALAAFLAVCLLNFIGLRYKSQPTAIEGSINE